MRPLSPPRALLAPVLALLLLPGCVVLEERLKQSQSEADTLREAVARANQKNAACEKRGGELSEELARTRKDRDEAGEKAKEAEGELERLRGRLTDTKKEYEGTTISREKFIEELLEKEKSTGKRIQELARKQAAAEERADGLDRELALARKELEDARTEGERLRRELDAKPSEEELRRERDLLLGRLERISEDRAEVAARRKKALAALAERLPALAPGTAVAAEGGFLRASFPVPPGRRTEGEVPKEWEAAVAAAAEAFRDEGGCSLLVSAGGKDGEALLRAAVEAGRFPPERATLLPPASPGRAELLLSAP